MSYERYSKRASRIWKSASKSRINAFKNRINASKNRMTALITWNSALKNGISRQGTRLEIFKTNCKKI